MSEFLRFRGSSKFFLIIFMPIIFLYFLGHIIKMIMTDSETKKIANVHDKLLAFMRIIEIDLSFTFLIYFICIEMTAFHEFTAICSIALVCLTFLLCLAHMLPESTEGQKTGKRFFKLVCKIANVSLCILGFF